MLVLGIQGSPRKKGNTNDLLTLFMTEAQKRGASTQVIDVDQQHIIPCKEYTTCEKKGFCPIKDDMSSSIYELLWRADVIIPATPMFFYGPTAQLKALIDRTQAQWARKYKLKMEDPFRKYRRGYFLSVGATKGKTLFDGSIMTMKYFFDAVGAEFIGSLTYRRIENPGDLLKVETIHQDVTKAVDEALGTLPQRKKVLFACRENACRSQMAGAFAQHLFGDKIDVAVAGSAPAEKINPMMTDVMKEKGLDLGFRTPRSLNEVIKDFTPEIIVTMGCGEECPFVPGAEKQDWDLTDPAGKPIEFMRQVRDQIELNVQKLIQTIL